MKKVITTMLVAAMVLSMAVPTSAATITRKKTGSSTSTSSKVSGDYSLKMTDKTLQFVRGGKVVSSIDTKDGKVTLRKSSAGGVSVVFTDAKGKRRNITLGKQTDVALSGTFVQLSVDKALGSTYEVDLEKGSKVSTFYAKGAAKVTLNGSVTTLNATSSSANVTVNGSVSKAYAVKKGSISGISASKITETNTGTSASGSTTNTGSSSSNTNWGNSGSTGSGSTGGVIGGIINGGGGTTTPNRKTVVLKQTITVIPEYNQGTLLSAISPATVFGLTATYNGVTVPGTFTFSSDKGSVVLGENAYRVVFTPTSTSTYSNAYINVRIKGKAVATQQTLGEAQAAVNTLIAGLSVDNSTTAAGILASAKGVVTNPSITVTSNVEVIKAEAGKPGSVKGTITLTLGTATATVTVDKTIAAVADTELAAAQKAVTDLNGKAYKDLPTAQKAITDAVKAAAPNVTADVSGVVLGADGKTAAGNVTLTKVGQTAVVAAFNCIIKEDVVSVAPVVTIEGATNMSEITYDKTKPVTLTAKATVDGKEDANIKYTWYRSTASNPNETTNRTVIGSGATYTISAGDVFTGGYYYFAIATHEVGEVADQKSGTSNTLRLTVKAGENATPIPVITTNIAANYTKKLAKGTSEKLTIAVAPVSKGTLSYQWYKSTNASDPTNMSTPITGATSTSYTVPNDENGTAYYFCVVTNTLNGDTEVVKSNYATMNVVEYITISSATSNGTLNTTTTTEIDVVFSSDVIGLTKDNFTIVGVKSDDKTPKITLDSVTDYTDNLKKYTLKVSGIDIAGKAIVTVKNLPAKYELVVPSKEVDLHLAAEAEAKAVSMATIPLAAGETESTKVKVTFDKTLTAKQITNATVANTGLQMGSTTTVTTDSYAVLSDVKVDTDKKSITITFKSAPGMETEVWLVRLLDSEVSSPKLHSTIVRAAAGSEFTASSAIVGTTNKELNITVAKELSRSLPSDPVSLFKFNDGKANDIKIASVTVPESNGGKVIRIILDDTSSAFFENGMKVTYTPTDTNNFIDTASNPGKLKAFTLDIINPNETITADTKAPAIQEVVILAGSEDKTAVVVMNMPIAPIESSRDGSTLKDLFKVTDVDGTELTVSGIKQTSYSKGRAALTNNAFEITFADKLPAGVQLKVSVKDVNLAAKVRPEGKAPEGVTPPTLPPTATAESPAVSVSKDTAAINKDINEKIAKAIVEPEDESGFDTTVYSNATNTLTLTVTNSMKDKPWLEAAGTGLMQTLAAFVDGTADSGYGITGATINGVYQKFDKTTDTTTDDLKDWFNGALINSIADTLSKKGYAGEVMQMSLNDLVNYMGDMTATIHYTKNDTAKTPFTLNYTVSFILGAPTVDESSTSTIFSMVAPPTTIGESGK